MSKVIKCIQSLTETGLPLYSVILSIRRSVNWLKRERKLLVAVDVNNACPFVECND